MMDVNTKNTIIENLKGAATGFIEDNENQIIKDMDRAMHEAHGGAVKFPLSIGIATLMGKKQATMKAKGSWGTKAKGESDPVDFLLGEDMVSDMK